MSAHGTEELVEETCPNEIIFNDFKKFEIIRVLNSFETNCSIFIEAKLKDKEEKAVIVLQKLPFETEKMEELFSSNTSLRTLFHNDVYYNQVGTLPAELNKIRTNIIYPAQESHIKKYEKNEVCFINETPLLYNEVTKPYIEAEAINKTWIYNILDHQKEQDRIIFEDSCQTNGFIMIPDFKWSGEQTDDLYLLALVMRRDIGSIRDLRAEHVPLLKNVYDKGVKAIERRYGLPEHKLRVYFHYQPSFYHLHLHFSAVTFDAPGTGVGKAHHIKSVIYNLENNDDYYQRATLPFTIKDNHPLREKFKIYGYFPEE